ncbi:membrane protein DedA with SNARE-associated domain [Paenibacillus shirakamiensis]|uniref:Membrane protein DedA with SNARE-associated domain n=1 Tax=Paenibacillus shirakamiensis TaxID=1265935 RepID=A0ABS4JL85_9BACL|nr:membrane protein DedA with SNARE-associated domain [Paenibacillus shirakamiensis]
MHILSDIIEQIFELIRGLGYLGIVLGLAIEVIPSEIVLAYGGFLVYQGDLNFYGAVFFGTVGALIQQLILYYIGRWGGRPFLDKFGKYIKITPHHMDIAQNWFNKYGSGIVFTARFVPVMRQVISIPAGIAKMSVLRFSTLTILASIPWSFLFVYLGKILGTKWDTIHEAAAPYVTPFILVAIAVLIVYLLIKWYSSKNKKREAK